MLRFTYLAGYSFLVAASVGIGYVLHDAGSVLQVPRLREERDRHTAQQYQFINPLLSCDSSEFGDTTNATLKELQEAVTKIITAHETTQTLSHASVYVRELNDGVWLGINERDEFTPGSLLKVPAVMSLYKYAEEKDSSILTRTVSFQEEQETSQHYPPRDPLTKNTKYSMGDLVQHALMYSDNNAAATIAQNIDTQYLLNAYKDLGISVPSLGSDEYKVRVKEYASFFRILYNATYISRTSSEFILRTLSQSTFVKGIVSGVPEGTMVAHKFGERVYDDGTKQLHDCGIVYAANPYVLCVMTKGGSFDDLERVISEISQVTNEKLEKASK